MREDVLVGMVVVLFALRDEAGLGLGRQGRVGPFALGLEEQGEGVCANVDGVGHGVLDAFCGSAKDNECQFPWPAGQRIIVKV